MQKLNNLVTKWQSIFVTLFIVSFIFLLAGCNNGGGGSGETNNPPTVTLTATPTNGTLPLKVTFSWQVSDLDGDSITCTLDINSDGSIDYTINNCTNGKTQEHTYTTQNKYTAKITASDNKGGSDSSSVEVAANQKINNPPDITSFSANPQSGTAPLAVIFSWQISDVDSNTLTCLIDTNNDNSIDYTINNCTNAKTQKHTYPITNSYTAKLTVRDSEGEADTETQTIQVNAQPPSEFASCLEILGSNVNQGDGIYRIDVDGNGSLAPFEVYCDMTHKGGGWTLYANHVDDVDEVKTVEKVNLTTVGVLTAPRWQALRDEMTTGMMFIDENNLIATISASKLKNGNCKSINDVEDLTSVLKGRVWHNENSGCSGTGRDYSLVRLSDKNDNTNSRFAGAALYQASSVKFDEWPYGNSGASYNEQNNLYYFIK